MEDLDNIERSLLDLDFIPLEPEIPLLFKELLEEEEAKNKAELGLLSKNFLDQVYSNFAGISNLSSREKDETAISAISDSNKQKTQESKEDLFSNLPSLKITDNLSEQSHKDFKVLVNLNSLRDEDDYSIRVKVCVNESEKKESAKDINRIDLDSNTNIRGDEQLDKQKSEFNVNVNIEPFNLFDAEDISCKFKVSIYTETFCDDNAKLQKQSTQYALNEQENNNEQELKHFDEKSEVGKEISSVIDSEIRSLADAVIATEDPYPDKVSSFREIKQHSQVNNFELSSLKIRNEFYEKIMNLQVEKMKTTLTIENLLQEVKKQNETLYLQLKNPTFHSFSILSVNTCENFTIQSSQQPTLPQVKSEILNLSPFNIKKEALKFQRINQNTLKKYNAIMNEVKRDKAGISNTDKKMNNTNISQFDKSPLRIVKDEKKYFESIKDNNFARESLLLNNRNSLKHEHEKLMNNCRDKGSDCNISKLVVSNSQTNNGKGLNFLFNDDENRHLSEEIYSTMKQDFLSLKNVLTTNHRLRENYFKVLSNGSEKKLCFYKNLFDLIVKEEKDLKTKAIEKQQSCKDSIVDVNVSLPQIEVNLRDSSHKKQSRTPNKIKISDGQSKINVSIRESLKSKAANNHEKQRPTSSLIVTKSKKSSPSPFHSETPKKVYKPRLILNDKIKATKNDISTKQVKKLSRPQTNKIEGKGVTPINDISLPSISVKK